MVTSDIRSIVRTISLLGCNGNSAGLQWGAAMGGCNGGCNGGLQAGLQWGLQWGAAMGGCTALRAAPNGCPELSSPHSSTQLWAAPTPEQAVEASPPPHRSPAPPWSCAAGTWIPPSSLVSRAAPPWSLAAGEGKAPPPRSPRPHCAAGRTPTVAPLHHRAGPQQCRSPPHPADPRAPTATGSGCRGWKPPGRTWSMRLATALTMAWSRKCWWKRSMFTCQ